jgi:hypothetical protein
LSNILFIVTVTLTFDPNINRVLSLSQGNYVAKFAKDPIYRTKVNISVISWRSVLLVEENGVNIIYSFRTITLVLYIGSLTNLAT